MDAGTPRPARARDFAILAAFALGLGAPLVDLALRSSDARGPARELRSAAKLPSTPQSLEEAVAFPRQFDNWYEDHFGLRDVLLRTHNRAKWLGLGVSPTPKLVLGHSGWVFSSEGFALDDHRGAAPLSPGALEAWRTMLEQRRDWLAQRGVHYVFAIAPYKSQVYNDELEPRFARLGPARNQQLAEFMARNSSVRIVDLESAVRAARADDRGDDLTYFPYGTHWTDRGAYAGYVELVSALAERFPELTPLPREAFEVRDGPTQGDSWAGRVYLEGLLEQRNLEWSVRTPSARYSGNFREEPQFVSDRADRAGPRALVYHDSFTLPMRPWLAEHFSHLVCDWTHTPIVQRIEAEKPDVLIQIYNGYTLMQLTPHALREEDGGRRAARFDASTQTLWRMEQGREETSLSVNEGAQLARPDGVLELTRESPASLLFLPRLNYPPGANLLVACELEGDEPGKLQVLYCTRRLPRIDRRQYVETQRLGGRERLVLEVPAADFVERMAIWLGPRKGRTRIHALEVRAVAPPH